MEDVAEAVSMLNEHDKIQAGAGGLGTLDAFLKNLGSSHHQKRDSWSAVPVEEPAEGDVELLPP